MRLRTERLESAGKDGPEEEIVIRYRTRTEEVEKLESAVRRLLSAEKGITLYREDTEFYLPSEEVLFFETDDRKVVAHTAKELFYAKDNLSALEQTLPYQFIRASKSCIVNAAAVFSIRRGITGVSEIGFRDTKKTAFMSRSYYRSFMDKMEEIRR